MLQVFHRGKYCYFCRRFVNPVLRIWLHLGELYLCPRCAEELIDILKEWLETLKREGNNPNSGLGSAGPQVCPLRHLPPRRPRPAPRCVMNYTTFCVFVCIKPRSPKLI